MSRLTYRFGEHYNDLLKAIREHKEGIRPGAKQTNSCDPDQGPCGFACEKAGIVMIKGVRPSKDWFSPKSKGGYKDPLDLVWKKLGLFHIDFKGKKFGHRFLTLHLPLPPNWRKDKPAPYEFWHYGLYSDAAKEYWYGGYRWDAWFILVDGLGTIEHDRAMRPPDWEYFIDQDHCCLTGEMAFKINEANPPGTKWGRQYYTAAPSGDPNRDGRFDPNRPEPGLFLPKTDLLPLSECLAALDKLMKVPA